ncbi:MAG: endolytic transglycosylase MltG [Clostridiales bacterium]|nr:endolytic transglycosylase MltG [Clostridiales bacterium]
MSKTNRDKNYTIDSLHKEREYGLYWYSWIWHIIRPLLIGVCALIVMFGLVSYGWGKISETYIDPVDSKDPSEIKFVVNSGDSLTRVATNLKAQNLIRNRSVFKYYADFAGFGQKIQAGDYTLGRDMSITQIAQRLAEGDGRPLVRNITIIPGWTIEDMAAYFVKEKVLQDASVFLEKVKTGKEYSAYYYIADVLNSGNAAQRKYALEGYLAANTYEIYTTATEDDIIKKMLSQTEGMYSQTYHDRASELNMNMDQVLSLASMIEKEAKTDDFGRVSAVFHNRIKQNQTLGSDVTLKYVLGTRRMVLGAADLSIDSPFNSYKNRGLPPGPICSPSPKAVEAALYPDQDFVKEGYFYFCSKNPDTGELHFSKTLAEHEQAVSIYRPLWEAFDQRTGAN